MKKTVSVLLLAVHLYAGADSDLKTVEVLQTRCVRIKLKKDCVEESREWFKGMMSQKEEVLKILEDQGVYVEAVFLDKIGEDDYLIYFMKEERTKKSIEMSSHSKHPISEGHRQYKNKCWEEKFKLEPLLDLDRIPH